MVVCFVVAVAMVQWRPLDASAAAAAAAAAVVVVVRWLASQS